MDRAAAARFEPVLDDLAERGWSVREDFWSEEFIRALRLDAETAQGRGEFAPARIGRGTGMLLHPEIRSDHIHWLSNDNALQSEYLAAMARLATLLNRELYLGLQSFEAHYAYYQPGAAYRRHRDSFQGNNPRRVSTISYLNPAWPAAGDGELVLYRDDAELARIAPEAGTFVTFLSQDFPHEVRAGAYDRFSIAGWFRVRPTELMP